MYHTFISATLIRWLITENVPWYDLFQVPFYWGKGEGILNPSVEGRYDCRLLMGSQGGNSQ